MKKIQETFKNEGNLKKHCEISEDFQGFVLTRKIFDDSHSLPFLL